MTFNVLKSLLLGSDFGGLGPAGSNTLVYSVNNAEGVEVVASTNNGLTERTAGGGSYRLLLNVDTAWGDFCEILWTIDGVPLDGTDEDLPVVSMSVALAEMAAISDVPTETPAQQNVTMEITEEETNIS